MDQNHLISGLDEALGTGELENEYVARIISEYGPPAFLNDKGRISKLGEPFWAALRAHETHTIFSPEENAFYRYNDSNGLYGKITEGALRTDFAHRILTAAKRWKEWAGLERFRSSTQINGIIRHLEGQTEVIDAFRSRQDWQPVIACANCVVRIDEENGELVKEGFSPKFRLRHVALITTSPMPRVRTLKLRCSVTSSLTTRKCSRNSVVKPCWDATSASESASLTELAAPQSQSSSPRCAESSARTPAPNSGLATFRNASKSAQSPAPRS